MRLSDVYLSVWRLSVWRVHRA